MRDTPRILLVLEDKTAIINSTGLESVVSNSSATIQSFNFTRPKQSAFKLRVVQSTNKGL